MRWRRCLIPLAVAGLLAAGCDGGAEPGGPLSIDVGGVDRTYLLHEPASLDDDARAPLVIAMHSYPGSGAALRSQVGLDAKADQHGFRVAYPDGLGGGFNALVCCGTADDLAFLETLTRHLVDSGRADPDRVYLTGISNGGDMAFRAAVERSGLFAAIAPISGGYIGPRTESDAYVPTSAVSVLTVIGDRDRYAASFQEGLTRWQERLECRPAPATSTGPAVARCADGSDVEVHVVAGMGHVWPDTPISATDLLWEFFDTHPRRQR